MKKKVARAIVVCRIPVVSAVGHEIDVSIADLVADRRALTPSEAGELIVPAVQDLRDSLEIPRSGFAAYSEAELSGCDSSGCPRSSLRTSAADALSRSASDGVR